MRDMLGQAVDWLNKQRVAHLAESVVYVRGAAAVNVEATLGSTRYEQMDEAGATVQAVATDFIIAARELVFDGVETHPQIGDRLRRRAGAKVLVFEVLDLAGAGHWRPADPFGQVLRIHTKQVDEETF